MPNPHNNDEIFLWRSVVDQALHDLGSDDINVRMDAEEWFDILNTDFVETCDLAELSPQEVLDFFSKNYNVLSNVEMTKTQRRRNAEPLR